MLASPVESVLSFLSALALSLVLISPAQAARVPDLYTAEVDAGLAEERQLEVALNQVMVKLSGRTDITAEPGAAVMRDNAALLLDSREDTAAGVRVRFDAASLSRLMANLGLPLLPEERLELLVWIARQQGEATAFVEPDAASYQTLNRGAQRRGLPLLIPLLDLQDQLALSADQLAALDQGAIVEASSRYPFDALLIGVYRGDRIDWTLWQQGQQLRAQSGTDAPALLQLIGRIADRLYGVETRAPTPLNLQPSAPLTGSAAAATTGALEDLPPVEVGPYQPEGEEVLIEGVAGAAEYLAITGALRQSEGILSVISAGESGARLRLIVQAAPEANLDALLAQAGLVKLGAQRYRWVGPTTQP